MKKLLLFAICAISCGMNAQTIQSVDPNSGSAGETLQVTITGDNTQFTQVSDASNISFYNDMSQQFLVSAFDAISDTEIIADVTIPYFIPTGTYNLSVYADGNQVILPNAFTVSNTMNIISGKITIDVNSNGCDAGDLTMGGIKVNINDGTNDNFTFTDPLGNYIFYVPAGNFVVTPQPEMPAYSITPGSATVNFATQNNLTETHDFCLAPDGTNINLSISVLELMPARPGFDAMYLITYTNIGNQVMSGSVSFTYNDAVLDFVSANPVTSMQSVNNLTWNYTNLMPFQSEMIYVTLNVNSPQETPAVNIGDILNFIATVNPTTGDADPHDNTFDFDQVVVGSYDPNDKAVMQGTQVSIEDVDEYLHYLIRFQNSGTFLAENVVIRDMLSSNLDVSTLQIVSTSHPYRTTLTEGNKLEVFFENINLPAEGDDEPGSHGFVAFKIKPISTLAIGDEVENTAEIYFDFNFPIITNTVGTTITALSTGSFDFGSSVVVYPNPMSNMLNVELDNLSDKVVISIYNQLGQIVKSVSDTDGSQRSMISVDDLSAGTYILKISSDKGTATKKLIKL